MNSRFRLKKSSDFKRVRQEGKSYAHPFVVLIVQKNNLEQIRVGIAASKTVGKAVQRNRAKRVLRAAISGLLPMISTGYDLVLIAREAILKENTNSVQTALQQKLKQAKLIRS